MAVRLVVLEPAHRTARARVSEGLHARVPLDACHFARGRDDGIGEAAALADDLSDVALRADAPYPGASGVANRAHHGLPIRCPPEFEQAGQGRQTGRVAPAPQRFLGARPNIVHEPALPATVEGALMHQEVAARRMPRQVADLAWREAEAADFPTHHVSDQNLPSLCVGEHAAVGRDRARRVPIGHGSHLVGGGQMDGIGDGVASADGQRGAGGGQHRGGHSACAGKGHRWSPAWDVGGHSLCHVCRPCAP